MSTLHLVDSELLAGLALRPPYVFTHETLADVRTTLLDTMTARLVPDAMPVLMTEHAIKGGSGQPMRVRVYASESSDRPAPMVLHMHGGGFVMGTVDIAEGRCRAMAHAVEGVVISVDYRLAPETPYPGPIEDCYAALCWACDQAEQLGINLGRIAVRGESAGAGLAAALALVARDRGGPAICHQNLIAPMLDDRTGSLDPNHSYAGEFMWTPEANRFGWTAMLGRVPGGEDVSPYAAPARLDDFSTLPPTFLSVGALDLFVDEDIEYARRLIRAGVPTELHVYPGAYHGFEAMAEAKVVRQAESDAMSALRRGLRSLEDDRTAPAA